MASQCHEIGRGLAIHLVYDRTRRQHSPVVGWAATAPRNAGSDTALARGKSDRLAMSANVPMASGGVDALSLCTLVMRYALSGILAPPLIDLLLALIAVVRLLRSNHIVRCAE
jgi:hypothetical protein